jgi:hypothetical protein
MRNAAANLSVFGGVVGKLAYERRCERRLLTSVCLVVQNVSWRTKLDAEGGC